MYAISYLFIKYIHTRKCSVNLPSRFCSLNTTMWNVNFTLPHSFIMEITCRFSYPNEAFAVLHYHNKTMCKLSEHVRIRT